uniref:DUF4604 domain-containing protein n=1 Tax=Parastrongyloides trichosuri TaxID=131310 RepID=A0A0N4ZCL7_PARTI
MESLQRSVYRHIGDLSYKRKAKKLVSEPSVNSILENGEINCQVNPCYTYDHNQNNNDNISYNFNNEMCNSKLKHEKLPENDNKTSIPINDKSNASSSKRLTSLISKPAVQSRKVSNSITKILGLKKHEKMINEIDDINSFSNIAEDQNTSVTLIKKNDNDNNNNDKILSSLDIEDDGNEKEKTLTKFQKLKKGLYVVDLRKSKPNAKKNDYKKCLIFDDED